MNKADLVDELLNCVRNNRVVAGLILFGIMIIGLASFTEALVKLTPTVRIIRSFVTSPFQPTNVETVLQKISFSSPDNFEKAYTELQTYLNLNNRKSSFIDQPKKLNSTLMSKKINGIAVISTVDQYNISGFLIFMNPKSGQILLIDSDFPLGIKSIKFIENTGGSPRALALVKYISITGTGTFGESIKFYALDSNSPNLALNKPYSEVNSGWGNFVQDTVEFRTRNDFSLQGKSVKIRTTGIVFIGNEGKQFKRIPEELYLWEPRSREFEQIKGRKTSPHMLMTEIYSDFANPQGNWFKKPQSVDKAYLRKIFIEEEW